MDYFFFFHNSIQVSSIQAMTVKSHHKKNSFYLHNTAKVRAVWSECEWNSKSTKLAQTYLGFDGKQRLNRLCGSRDRAMKSYKEAEELCRKFRSEKKFIKCRLWARICLKKSVRSC
jgi:hypothetical protein